eukprot:UN05930
MFVTHKLQLLKVSEMIVACQKYPQKELVANVLCCDDSVPQSSALIGTKDHSSKINEIKRSITRIKRDQKIKDQAVSRIKVQQRSKINKIKDHEVQLEIK